MATDRYVCLSCRKGHDTPGLCPHCPRGELLDMTIASDRELLADQQRLTAATARRSLVLFAGVVAYMVVGVGLTWLLSTQLGWSSDAAGMVSVLGTGALLLPLILWSYRGTPDAPSPEQPFSEIDPVQWESLLDAPEPDAEAPARQPRQSDLS